MNKKSIKKAIALEYGKNPIPLLAAKGEAFPGGDGTPGVIGRSSTGDEVCLRNLRSGECVPRESRLIVRCIALEVYLIRNTHVMQKNPVINMF